MKTALILGITGQDGSYLAEQLLAEGYAVHGLVRRASMFNRSRIEHLRAAPAPGTLTLHYGDLTDVTSLRRIFEKEKPQEIYHLAGQSHVGLSFEIPEVTCQENGTATLALLEILRDLGYPVRFYHAASSEVFGAPATAPQSLPHLLFKASQADRGHLQSRPLMPGQTVAQELPPPGPVHGAFGLVHFKLQLDRQETA